MRMYSVCTLINYLHVLGQKPRTKLMSDKILEIFSCLKIFLSTSAPPFLIFKDVQKNSKRLMKSSFRFNLCYRVRGQELLPVVFIYA